MIRARVSAAALAFIVVGATSVGTAGSSEVSPASPTETTNISVVNDGTATRGSTVDIFCVTQIESPPPGSPGFVTSTGVLNFDASGTPTTKSGSVAESFSAVGNSWVAVGVGVGAAVCVHTMSDNGGAESTSWTCGFVTVPAPTPANVGCESASGSGRAPAVLNWALDSAELTSETATIVFTNSYPAPVKPNFTG